MLEYPTYEELSARLFYDAVSGGCFWKPRIDRSKSWNARFANQRAGSVEPRGYRKIGFQRAYFFEHRIAWIFINRTEPPKLIDHIDGDKGNNRASNLRAADRSQNLANSNVGWGVGGVRGVHWKAREGCWYAQIMVRGRCHYLGLFKSLVEGKAAYDAASDRLNAEFSPSFRRQLASDLPGVSK